MSWPIQALLALQARRPHAQVAFRVQVHRFLQVARRLVLQVSQAAHRHLALLARPLVRQVFQVVVARLVHLAAAALSRRVAVAHPLAVHRVHHAHQVFRVHLRRFLRPLHPRPSPAPASQVPHPVLPRPPVHLRFRAVLLSPLHLLQVLALQAHRSLAARQALILRPHRAFHQALAAFHLRVLVLPPVAHFQARQAPFRPQARLVSLHPLVVAAFLLPRRLFLHLRVLSHLHALRPVSVAHRPVVALFPRRVRVPRPHLALQAQVPLSQAHLRRPVRVRFHHLLAVALFRVLRPLVARHFPQARRPVAHLALVALFLQVLRVRVVVSHPHAHLALFRVQVALFLHLRRLFRPLALPLARRPSLQALAVAHPLFRVPVALARFHPLLRRLALVLFRRQVRAVQARRFQVLPAPVAQAHSLLHHPALVLQAVVVARRVPQAHPHLHSLPVVARFHPHQAHFHLHVLHPPRAIQVAVQAQVAVLHAILPSLRVLHLQAPHPVHLQALFLAIR